MKVNGGKLCKPDSRGHSAFRYFRYGNTVETINIEAKSTSKTVFPTVADAKRFMAHA
jgi:hypothetical protein